MALATVLVGGGRVTLSNADVGLYEENTVLTVSTAGSKV